MITHRTRSRYSGARLITQRSADGTTRRIEAATLAKEARRADWLKRNGGLLGATFAGCEAGRCYVGTVVRVCKAHLVIATRAGARILVPDSTPESLAMGFAEWDAAVAAQNQERAALGMAPVEIIP
jgi:hypothetical protein